MRNTILLLICVSFVISSSNSPGAEIRLANGVRLHYETSGRGNIPVVLVHGYGMSSAAWEKVMPLFPSDYRLFAVDIRGFGRSDKPETGYTCPELADDIAAFLDALKISRAMLIGHSFGGLVIQHFAARHPDRVLALVLSNTFAATLPPKGLTASVEQRINGYGSSEENRKIFSSAIPRYFDADNVNREDISHFVEIGLQASNTALRETLKANYATPSIPTSQYALIRAPIIILVTTHDPFGTFEHAIAMSDALPNSCIRVIAHCGHSPMWEKPTEFTRTITESLKTSDLR